MDHTDGERLSAKYALRGIGDREKFKYEERDLERACYNSNTIVGIPMAMATHGGAGARRGEAAPRANASLP